MKNIPSYRLGPQGDVSIEALYKFCVKQNGPLIFTGLFDALPELTQWSSAKLRQLLGNRQVMVNVSETGLFNRSQMQAMPFQEYADYLELPPEEKKDIRYMQQQSISGGLANGCFPELSALVAIDKYFPEHAIWEQNLWFGPAGCMTGLHFDIPKNFFMQIQGRKKFYIVPPNSRNKLYAHPAMSPRPNFSRVDLTTDYEREFPLVAQTDRYEITLEPGSMLYLPECWWHQVLSLDNALSVNIWGNSRWVGLLQEQIASLPIMGRGLIGTIVNLFNRQPSPAKPADQPKQTK
jgi:ribosomal protein L16 Arg81 hydroxylase